MTLLLGPSEVENDGLTNVCPSKFKTKERWSQVSLKLQDESEIYHYCMDISIKSATKERGEGLIAQIFAILKF